MRPLTALERFRVREQWVLDLYGTYGDDKTGCFTAISPFAKEGEDNALRIIAGAGLGWDHVSISLETRCPTWEEMSRVKDMFFLPEECVVQFHPPKSKYVNFHPYTLHLWRCWKQEYILPPTEFIA